MMGDLPLTEMETNVRQDDSGEMIRGIILTSNFKNIEMS